MSWCSVAVRVALGVPSSYRVFARLYKLLLYERGGHFAKHRDTEKENGSSLFSRATYCCVP